MLDEQASRFCVMKMRHACALRGGVPKRSPRSIRNDEGAKVRLAKCDNEQARAQQHKAGRD